MPLALAGWPGCLASADVPDVMRGLDCFVLPSLAEGISNTILEAIVSCLPVLATDAGGNSDLIAAHLTGELVPVSDVGVLAVGLVRTAADPKRAFAMGVAGMQRVERHFSLPATVSAYQDLYDWLQAGRVHR